MPNSIQDLAQALLQREMERDPDQFRESQFGQPAPQEGMSPHTLATLGGLADAASTYAFMKRGTARETNPLVNAIAGQHPELTGLTALGGLAATKALTKLIGKKWPRVADALAANLGAEQLSLATNNTANTFRQSQMKRPQGSFGTYGDTMIRSGINQSRLKQSR